MKNLIYAITITIGLWSCNHKKTENSNQKDTADFETQSKQKQKPEIYIKDKSKYDPVFIEGLADYNEPIKLIDNYIITGEDTTYFLENLPINKETIFKNTSDKNIYLLKITRTNLTSLNYEFELKDKNNKTLDSQKGKAILGSMFFLGSESDEDNETNEGYGSIEYWDKTKECWIAIRIGIDKDDNGKFRAILNYACEDHLKPIADLEDCPTLRTE